MRDPDRLLSSGATEEERALLSAAAAELPPADGPDRLRILLGLSGAALASGAVAASAHSLPPSAAANAVMTTGKTAAVGTTVKAFSAKLVVPWLALALTAAGIATAVLVLDGRRDDVQPAERAPVAHPSPAPSRTEPALPLEREQASDVIDREQPVDASARQRAADAPKLSQSIARETADLDAARAALRKSNAGLALRELDRYADAHPHGVLRQEASVLRIEASLAAGDASQARRVANEFLRAYPASAYAARVRRLLDDASRER